MNGSTSKKETGLARTHLKAMGRDEMNLAEFPLATLADRAPRGCKTLVFEDTIWDKSQRLGPARGSPAVSVRTTPAVGWLDTSLFPSFSSVELSPSKNELARDRLLPRFLPPF